MALETALYLLRKDADWHFWLRVEIGLEYIDQVLRFQSPTRERIVASPEFWAWWHNEWFNREVRLNRQLLLEDGLIVYFRDIGQPIKQVLARLTWGEFEAFYTTLHRDFIRTGSMPDKPVLERMFAPAPKSLTTIHQSIQ